MVTADIESPLLGSLTSSVLDRQVIANPPPWFTQISSFEARAAFPVTPSEHSRKNTQCIPQGGNRFPVAMSSLAFLPYLVEIEHPTRHG